MSSSLRHLPLKERIAVAEIQLKAIKSSSCPRWLYRKYEQNLYKMKQRLIKETV